MSKTGKSLWAVDLIKVIAAQLILLHHMIAYGPMSWVLYPHHTALFDWFFEYARMAVQAFLVVGGFLAARSLVPAPEQIRFGPNMGEVWRLIRARYLRLAPPFLLAIALTTASAWIVRLLIQDSDTPPPATWGQMLAHVFFVQDVLGLPAMTAGAWYVAIDLQLYALLALLAMASHRIAKATGTLPALWMMGSVLLLAAASLLGLGIWQDLDMWAPYFFGAYGLGVLVQWGRSTGKKRLWYGVIASLVAVALLLQWRERIAIAACTALVLMVLADRPFKAPETLLRYIRALSDRAYTLFLVHYSIILLVGGIVTYYWPENPVAAAWGMGAIWMVSMAGAWGLHRATEALMARWR